MRKLLEVTLKFTRVLLWQDALLGQKEKFKHTKTKKPLGAKGLNLSMKNSCLSDLHKALADNWYLNAIDIENNGR